jgi:molybdopterin synthase sulfur carrier subunit
MITVLIPIPLRKFTSDAEEVVARGMTVAEIIDDLDGSYPGLKSKLCAEDGKIRPFVNIYVNSEDIRFLQGMDTPVGGGDELSIVPAMAGGSVPQPAPNAIREPWPQPCRLAAGGKKF